jgi:hypothetical protein
MVKVEVHAIIYVQCMVLTGPLAVERIHLAAVLPLSW